MTRYHCDLPDQSRVSSCLQGWQWYELRVPSHPSSLVRISERQVEMSSGRENNKIFCHLYLFLRRFFKSNCKFSEAKFHFSSMNEGLHKLSFCLRSNFFIFFANQLVDKFELGAAWNKLVDWGTSFENFLIFYVANVQFFLSQPKTNLFNRYHIT